MKILQLAPRFPFPLDDGGKIVVANTFREFVQQGVSTILFSLNSETELPKTAIQEAEKIGKNVIFNYNTKNTIGKIARSVFTNKAIYLQKYWNKNILEAVDTLILNDKPDILQAEHTCMTPICLYFREKYNIPFGIRLHNIEHKIWEKYAEEMKNPFAKIYLKQQTKLLKKREIELIEQANISFAITQEEKKEIDRLTNNVNVHVASVGVELDKWTPSDFSYRNKNQLVFATTFHWIHNTNALLWFLKNVLPIVYEKNNQVKMMIIGKNAPKWIENYANIGANSLGYLSDIRGVVRQSAIYVAPLFVGAGIRIKILEAMAMGMPVVATSVSAAGINATENDGLFITDDKEKYAEIILELMNNAVKCENAGIRARQFVEKKFSWKENVKKMILQYEEILKNK